ncbi:MAG: hypothetical protein GF331_16005 [Chitinivibrionales bacterium]|nr:hypothetical protein [Chitinivibrionales bacterium]
MNTRATPAWTAVFALLLIAPGHAARSESKPPFSVDALQWLLGRGEYDRFDWYIERYINYYPDTAVLHLIRGYRYFHEASDKVVRSVHKPQDRTGGIPRRYPEYLIEQAPPRSLHIVESYSEELLRHAIASMHKALLLDPERRDVWVAMCHMTAQAGRPDLLRDKVEWARGRFECDSQIVNMALELSSRYYTTEGDTAMIALLRTLSQHCGAAALRSATARHFLHAGRFDSASVYLRKALAIDDGDAAALGIAVSLAALRGEFSYAMKLCERRYRTTEAPGDLEMAAIFAIAAGERSHNALVREIAEAGLDSDSSLLRRFREHLDGHAQREPRFFGGELFALNFPLVAMAYEDTRDTVAYYLHKAGLFYAQAVYDSAAHYNLRLLRWRNERDGMDYSTAFNLAAEYYAAGEFLMSYVRFMDLYRYADGKADVGVRYALAVNCETYGDLKSAAFHYRFVSEHTRTRYERFFPLRQMASDRLEHLRGKTPMMQDAMWY